MKKILGIFIFVFLAKFAFASHITGGEIYYTYLGASTSNPGKLSYKITLVLYKDSTIMGANVANLGYAMYFSIYRGDNNQHVEDKTATLTKYESMRLSANNPCITNPQAVWFAVATYETTFDVDPLAAGYYAANSQCCRVANVVNMNSTQIGATYWVKIPGINEDIYAPNNSNAVFNKKDTIRVCKSSPINLDFSAADPDGDQLRYRFVTGYIGAASGPTQAQITPVTADVPAYTGVTYTGSYTSTQPLGSLVTIDSTTGNVTGTAPAVTGVYLITVLVEEYRNGFKISEHRKEFQVRVDDCTLTGAALKPTYITCTGTTLSFQNESTSSNIVSYLWDFGIPGINTDTSSSPTPTYDYLSSGKDSGTFTVKLKVLSNSGCQDSTTSLVKVYPGFQPGFTASGTCYLNNYLFSDTSKIKYGTVTSRFWDFGDATTLADTAHSKDTAWKYPAAASVQVKLIVGNNIGCIDTVTQSLTVVDKPTLSLPFRDTLICSIDTLMLKVNITGGSVLWTPMNGPNKTRILNANTATPLVFPQDSTKYYVAVNNNGCANTDSVMVNVLKFITVDAGPDTGICKTDTFRLKPVSAALSYVWSSSTIGEKVDPTKYPLVQPLVNTQYNVIANLGKCQAKDSVAVTVSPYPNASAGPDVTICYGTRVQLNGSVNGSVFSWSPTVSLINQNTLTPIAGPTKTTAYILTTTNATGCLKSKTDTVIVTVIPPIYPSAGKDTFAVPGQSLQLQASGGADYVWTPSSFLSNPTISNPVAVFDNSIDSIVYSVRVINGACYADAGVKVRIFKTGPDIIVPSGFTPNGDGKNDVIRPILLGINKLIYFSVYNRWGQLMFSTTEENKGWDGNFGGYAQPSGTYVYQALGTDYTGKTILRKGTVVLIR